MKVTDIALAVNEKAKQEEVGIRPVKSFMNR